VTTIYDVARVAGVSTATVSRVLRGSESVRSQTRQRVLAIIEMLAPRTEVLPTQVVIRASCGCQPQEND
jgi:hypothetical protein